MSSSVSDIQKCEYCSSEEFAHSRGEIICIQCGTVQEKIYTQSTHSMIDNSYEGPTQYTSIGKRIDRVGELGSEIGYFNSRIRGTTRGRKISSETAMRFNRLNVKFHRPIKNASTQTHLRTFSIFNRVASHLQLTSSLRERTSYLYWKYVNNKEHRISNHVLLIAMCLLYAVRENQEKSPFKFQEIIAAFEKGGHRVTNRNILQLANDLKVNLNRVKVRKSEDYLRRITEQVSNHDSVVSNLDTYGLSPGTYQALLTKIGEYFLSTIGRRERGGVQPYGYAVSVIYLADRGIARYFRKTPVLTQALVAKITGAREYTIRDHCYKSLSKRFENNRKQIFSIIREFLHL